MLRNLQQIAAIWGWVDLERFRDTMPADSTKPAQPFTWYESGVSTGGRLDLFLQINECPIGQQLVYTAAVYAPRYRLNSGWHFFSLPRNKPADDERIVELSAWLHRDHFISTRGRQRYRAAHPETVGYSWKRIAETGPPWIITDVAAKITELNPRVKSAR